MSTCSPRVEATRAWTSPCGSSIIAARVTKKPSTTETTKAPARPKKKRDADATRSRIEQAALTLIRTRGFDATTMRDIAASADVSLGLAYHYYDSKEALAVAFYGDHIARHDELTRAAIATRPELADRIEAALLIGLDVRVADKPVMLVMARTVLDAENPTSLFSTRTEALRARSIGVFRAVADVPELDETLKEPLALALWALHLGVLLRFVHDDTPGQKQTRALIAGAARLAAEVSTMLSLPFLDGMRGELLEVLRQGGLLRAGPSAQTVDSALVPEAAAPTVTPLEAHGTKPRDASLDLPPRAGSSRRRPRRV